MPLQDIYGAGWLKAMVANFAELAGFVSGDVGLGGLRVARFVYDCGIAGNLPIGAHGTGITIPADAIIVGGFVDVNTAFTGDANATLAIHVQAANDIISAAAVSGAPYSTIGRKAIVPKANTPESTSVKTTAAREITGTVATAALLTGKLTGYLYYVEGIASA